MNIAVQVCGLVNIIVLLIFYLSAKRLKLYKRRIFYHILLISVANISFDILSVFAIHYRAQYPILYVNCVCKMYLCMLIFQGWSALIYATADAMPKQRHIMTSSIIVIAAIIECFEVFKFPISIYDDGYAVYTYGDSVMLVYFFTAFNICAIWISTIIFSNKIKRRRRNAVRLWMVIWLLGMCIQAFNNEILVAGFATSLGMMVVYFILENPEANIDKQFVCLNSIALSEYAGECILNGDPFSLCNIDLENVSVLKGNNKDTEKKMRELIEYLYGFKHVYVFKNLDKNIILGSEDTDSIKRVIDGFIKKYRRVNPNGPESKIILLEDAQEFQSIEEILRLFSYMNRRRYEGYKDIITVEPDNVADYERQDRMRGEIRRALNEDRVEVFLQPIYNTVKGSFTSAEALVRIRNRDGTLIPPGQFIPVAEETGQIIDLGQRVLDKTCEFMAGSEVSALGLEYIEVNLSVVQAEKLTLVDEIMDTVRKYNVEPERINLEITESALIQAKDRVLDNMNRLKNKGFSFALDDFGKGESNLMYLVEMPFDVLKLDMDMTKAFHVNDKAKSAVRTVRYMADDMKLKIVAEGIENQHELDAFMKYDIEYIQGFHFSKPLPMDEFVEFVSEYNKKKETNMKEVSNG